MHQVKEQKIATNDEPNENEYFIFDNTDSTLVMMLVARNTDSILVMIMMTII